MTDRPDRLDRFLARMLPEHSRSRLVKLIGEGTVMVDGRAQRPSFQLEPGMAVELPVPADAPPHDLSPADIPLSILYEDDDLLVVDKPRGLAAHPAASLKEPSLVNALLARMTPLSSAAGAFRPGIVHRLDKETTGLMVVAKHDRAHAALAAQIERKTAERRYLAVVAGDIQQPRFTVEAAIARSTKNRLLMAVDPNGKAAVTHVKRLESINAGTVIACRLETGRTHQIRVHLAAVGHPVLGDRLYAPREYSTGPMQLHAAYLAFDQPMSGEGLAFYAPPDDDFLGREFASREAIEGF